MTPRYLRIPDATAYSGMSRTAIYMALATNKIAAVKSGRATLIDRESLDRHLAALPPADIRLPSIARAA